VDEDRVALIDQLRRPRLIADDHHDVDDGLGGEARDGGAVNAVADARAAFLFRDDLRAHPEDAARYAALKRELAGRYSTDRDGYTSFVDAILARATASRAAP